VSDWARAIFACPRCAASVELDASAGKCPRCAQGWTQEGNVTTWSGAHPVGDERAVASEWLRGRGTAKRIAWTLLKIAGYPLRRLFNARIAAFQRRALTDQALADEWRRHYLKGIALGGDPVVFEYSYRKAEKAGFAGLLGFRIVAQDIRTQPWWREDPHVRFQVVPPEAPRFPLRDGVAELAFVDGVIFDQPADALETFFRECLRILHPNGHLVVWGGNSLSPSRTRSEIRWHGRIHSLAEVRAAAARAGFRERDVSFEGFAPPAFPEVINMLRLALAPWPVKTHDHHSWLARLQRPERRAYWLLRMSKP
jgi:SAM-dependent methyltransferase